MRTSDRKQMVQLLWETGTRNIITIQNKTGTARATLFRWIAKLKKRRIFRSKTVS